MSIKKVAAFTLFATFAAKSAVGDEVIRMVSHNPPFGFAVELEKVLETYPNLSLSREWYSYLESDLWVFFIADGGEADLDTLPRFAQEIYAESGSSNAALMKFAFGDATHVGEGEITVAFFNESFSQKENFACISANLVVQVYLDQVVRNADSILVRCGAE